MAYSTSQLDQIIATLESSLSNGVAEISFGNDHIKYSTAAEVRNGIAYFKALYASATDAPSTATPRVRTYYGFGGKGIGF